MPVLLVVLACLSLVAEEPAGVITDQAVRYVNAEVLTLGDVLRRDAYRQEEYRRRGLVLPDTPVERRQFLRETLEDLTTEALLVQKADELHVPIDRDRLAEEVLAEARERGLPLRLVAELRRIRERQAKVDLVLGFYEDRSDQVGPETLAAVYEQRKDRYRLPTRARALLLAVRPTGADERQDLVRALAATMKAAQTAIDPQLRAEATGRLDAFLAADVAGQQRILVELAAALGTQADRIDLAPADTKLASDARALAVRWGKVRDRDAAQAFVEGVRSELVALEPERRGDAFRNRARADSQGPHAADGGDLGWVQAGSYGKEIEEQIFAMPPGEPSGVFWTGGAAALVLVIEREDGRQQGFDEVSGLLAATLDRERRQRIRDRVAETLRRQASIRDIQDLARLTP
jgi:hypothetical protein